MMLIRQPKIVSHSDNHHRLFYYLFLIACMLVSGLLHAEEKPISIIYAGEKPYTRKVIQQLYQQLDTLPLGINTINIDNEPLSRAPIKYSSLLITLGTKATKETLALKTSLPMLSLLIPSLSYKKLHEKYNTDAPWKVIFIDQPFERQINFIQALLGKNKLVASILGPYSKDFASQIKQAARQYKQKVKIETIHSEKQLIPTLRPLVKSSDILLAIADPVTFNKKTIRSILLLSYHQGIPLIGFSRSYVKAGAIGAVFSDPEQISKQASAIIKKFLRTGKLASNAIYTDDFSIAINKNVARTLNIYLADEKNIYQKMQDSQK